MVLIVLCLGVDFFVVLSLGNSVTTYSENLGLTTSIPSLGGLFRNSMGRKTGRHDMTITVDVARLNCKTI